MAGLKYGSKPITNVKYGSKQVTQVWYGTKLVWGIAAEKPLGPLNINEASYYSASNNVDVTVGFMRPDDYSQVAQYEAKITYVDGTSYTKIQDADGASGGWQNITFDSHLRPIDATNLNTVATLSARSISSLGTYSDWLDGGTGNTIRRLGGEAGETGIQNPPNVSYSSKSDCGGSNAWTAVFSINPNSQGIDVNDSLFYVVLEPVTDVGISSINPGAHFGVNTFSATLYTAGVGMNGIQATLYYDGNLANTPVDGMQTTSPCA